jgi:hypothetical protein
MHQPAASASDSHISVRFSPGSSHMAEHFPDCQSASVTVYQPDFLLAYLSIYLPAFLSAYLPACISNSLTIWCPVYLPICQSFSSASLQFTRLEFNREISTSLEFQPSDDMSVWEHVFRIISKSGFLPVRPSTNVSLCQSDSLLIVTSTNLAACHMPLCHIDPLII